jgi:signal peptidase II
LIKLAIFGTLFPLIMVLDIVTKRWALSALAGGRRLELFDGLVPLTLAFNRGAAFGIRIGEDSRWFFVPVTIVALVLLGVLFKQAERSDWVRIGSLTLVVSGAIGNLYDRVRWSRGVVDFIGPLDLGFWNFPIFNVADMSISCGAVLLAVSFWQEEDREREAAGVEGEAREPAPEAAASANAAPGAAAPESAALDAPDFEETDPGVGDSGTAVPEVPPAEDAPGEAPR